MFVMSYWIDDNMCLELKNEVSINNYKEPAYKQSEDWYKYIFIDGMYVTCPSKEMMSNLLKKATYDRWIYNLNPESVNKPDCQLFGLSRYSFVALVNDGWFTKNIISTHFQNIYFELTLLCLLQRTYIINFQNEVSRIAKLLEENQSNLRQIKQDISKMYLLYIKYTNRIYFREVTPQEQGIELYDLLQQQMHIKEDLELLGKEIQELNTYVETYEQSYLNKLATFFLPFGLFAGLLGINTINSKSELNGWGWTKSALEILSVVLFVLAILTTIYLIIIYFKTKLKR